MTDRTSPGERPEERALLLVAGLADLVVDSIGTAAGSLRSLLGRADSADLAQEAAADLRARGRLALDRLAPGQDGPGGPPHMEALARAALARRSAATDAAPVTEAGAAADADPLAQADAATDIDPSTRADAAAEADAATHADAATEADAVTHADPARHPAPPAHPAPPEPPAPASDSPAPAAPRVVTDPAGE
ncbi:putative membrane protein [Streptomyces filamentosus]